jgi:chemotaxis protein MotB
MKRSLIVMVLALAACGVPEAKYDAAVKDATSARADLGKCQEAVKRIDDLEAQIKQLNDDLAVARGHAQTDEEKAELEELRKRKAEAEARAKLLDEFVLKFKAMIDAGKLKIVVRRGRLVLQLKSEVLFNGGSAEIRPAGKLTLIEIAQTLKTVQGRRFQIAGHTDIIGIKTKEFPSNWELSVARAMEVLKLLLAQGVPPQSLSAAGFGPYDPVASNNSAYGQALNRRIEITLIPNIEDLAKLPEFKDDKPDKK